MPQPQPNLHNSARSIMSKEDITVEELTLLHIGMADFEGFAATERHEIDTAPILSIPNELTIMIFSFACHSPPLFLRHCIAGDRSGESSKCEEATALVISRVCHPWRRISLDCPELWTTFNDTRKRYNAKTLKDRLDAYMERSNSKLLDTRVCLSADDKGAIFEVLASPRYRARWRRISLCGAKVRGKDGLLYPMSKDSTAKYPNLKTLEINQLGDKFHWHALQTMLNSQKLESLRIPNSLWFEIPSSSSLSVLQIVGHLSSRVTVHFMEMLKTLPNLKALSITHPDQISSLTASYTDLGICITLPGLEYIRCGHYAIATMICSVLRAPQLKCLIFDGLNNLNFLNYPSSNDSQSPPFPSLDILALVGCVTLPREVAAIEGKFPGISQLIISQNFNIPPRNRSPDFYTNHILMSMKAWRPVWAGSTTLSRMHMLCMGPHRQDTKLQMHSISRAVRLLRRHKIILGSTWKLCIEPGFSRTWQALDPERWISAQSEGLFEDAPNLHAGETDYPWTYEARYNDGSLSSPYIYDYSFETI